MRRPLAWTAAALLGGAACSSFFRPHFLPFLAAFLAALSLAILLIVAKRRKQAAVIVLLSAFLLGVSIYTLNAYVSEIPDEISCQYVSRSRSKVRLLGVVNEYRRSVDGGRITFVLDGERIEEDGVSEPTKGRVLVNWYRPSGLIRPGDFVAAEGRLGPLKGFKNPRTFDYERYMYRRGIYTRMLARGPDSAAVAGTAGPDRLMHWGNALRRKGLDVISRSVRTAETRAFLSAILLGERGLLTEEMKEWFRRTGTFHILAISGLHVGLVYLVASLALAPFPLGVKTRLTLSICVVWLYALVTGAGVPVTRASIALTLVLSGYYLGRESDFLTSIAAAAIIVVALDPLVIDEVGFQMSFTAVLLLCTFEPAYSEKIYPAVQRRLPKIPPSILHRLALTYFATLIVGFGLLPLSAYHFNLISLVFPFANLIVVPLLSVVLASGFACLLAGLVWAKAAAVFGLIAEAFAQVIFATVKICSAVPGSSMRVASPPVWALGLGAFAVTLAWWRNRLRTKALIFSAAAGLVCVAAFIGGFDSRNVFRAIFFDVGDADSCFLEFPGGETMLIDTGFASANFDCGEQLIGPFLWKKRVGRLDTLLLTHPDADHTGGAVFLMENFQIGRLWLSGPAAESPEFSNILRVAREKAIPVRGAEVGDLLVNAKGVRAEVLYPPEGISRGNLSDNETSVVVKISYGKTSILLTGDAEKRALSSLTGLGEKLGSQVLKAPHHGHKNSFSKRFIDCVRPELVVISGRTYRVNEHMEDRVLLYSASPSKVLSTQDCGAVVIEADGRSLKTVTTRHRPRELF